MIKFIKKTLLFCIPILVLTVLYVITDVFKVIYHYDSYYSKPHHIDINRSYASVMTYINHYPEYNYDSFILGNSRSLLYEIDTWKQHLSKESSCMHLDDYRGSITGIRDKIAYIDKTGGALNNVLLVLDYEILSCLEQDNGYLFISPPVLKGNANFIRFHLQHLTAFLKPKFLMALADYNLFGKIRPYMKDCILIDNTTYIDRYNEIQESFAEEQIRNGTYYDARRISFFEGKQKPGTFSTEQLGKKEISYLNEISDFFKKHNTSYKIVISPLYDQVKLKRETLSILQNIFGQENVFDFSGENKWNADYHNYYEDSHYRPIVSAEIMDIIYKPL